MKTVICLLLLVVTLLSAQPAAAISGMCAAASFFNTLCWIEIELNAGDEPPDQRSYPYGY